MRIVVESTFELEFTRIAAVKVQCSFFFIQYNFHFKNEDIVLFCCCICVYSTIFYKNICFNLTTLGDLKMAVMVVTVLQTSS
jgi:hypothetical protein